MHSDITGIILAGGRSTRMGTNKALLPFGNATMIESVAKRMVSLFSEVLLSTNTPEEYAMLSLRTVPDLIDHRGPLAGIHAGLTTAATERIFVLSCDMPMITPDIIEFIISYPTARPIVVARADGFVQQLCGIYSKSILPLVQEIIAARKQSVQKEKMCPVLELVRKAEGEIIDIESHYNGYRAGSFINVNNPDDVERLAALGREAIA
ncbi:MAG: molybdenum cofactor guanylyltransferase [Ignavibacteriales bacterium]|nr:molybdenum cofactor guanylyltransferase [Ignavibacteriales bacterium]